MIEDDIEQHNEIDEYFTDEYNISEERIKNLLSSLTDFVYIATFELWRNFEKFPLS